MSGRVEKSLKNTKISAIFYGVTLLITFISRKIFLDTFGPEILGLNTTINNLLGFLNLAELGIGTAVSYMLFKPLYENDHKKINDIISIQGYLYRKIGIIIIILSLLILLLFPYIFRKAHVGFWVPYVTFIVFLANPLFSYFLSYKQILFTSDQKEFKNTQIIQTTKIVKNILQIIVIFFVSESYYYWLVIEFLSYFVMAILINREVNYSYHWLNIAKSKGKELQKNYPEIIIKTKQLLFHSIGNFVLTQTSPLIIYFYLTLTIVNIYSNYQIIILGLLAVMNIIFNSMIGAIGNLIAENNKEKIYRVFWEIFSIRYFVSSVLCFGLYSLVNQFVAIWLGNKYIIDDISLIIMVANVFILLTRTTVDHYIVAYGLYHDVFAPIVEIVLNLSLSFVLGYYFGLPGILGGVFVSLFIVIGVWKPYLLFRYGLKEKVLVYYFNNIKLFFIFLFSGLFTLFYIGDIKHYFSNKYLNFVCEAAIKLTIFIPIIFILYYIFDRGTRCYTKRFYKKFFKS